MSYPIPAGLDPKLEYYLKQLERRVGTLEGESAGEDTGEGGGDDTGTVSTFVPVYESPVTLADQGTGTEGSWTTVSAGAPAESRYAIIIFEVESTDNADVGDLKWRTQSGAAEIPAVFVDADEDDAQPRIVFFVPLDSSGQFQYLFTNTSTTTINWAIYYVGYVQ